MANRVTVWVQRFPDRENLMLQWHDPETGRRRSRSAGTADEKEAEKLRADLEYELNHGRHQEASRMGWEGFRALFEAEYAAGKRERTREKFATVLDAFEHICNPRQLGKVTERTLSVREGAA
jgi:hypothetical protein